MQIGSIGITARRCALALALLAAGAAAARAQGWASYGGDPEGTRFSPAAQITRQNVEKLALAWTYHTGAAERPAAQFRRSAFEDTPVLADGRLLVCTPFDRVVALEPVTGREQWVYDPGLPATLKPGNGPICRGVAVWHDPAAAGAPCAARLFLGTNDARLIALDLATGRPCAGFGNDGAVALAAGVTELYPGQMQVDTPPAVIADTVIVGSAVDDMSQAAAPAGTVRAFDARSGAPRWRFDPRPPGATAGGNVWSPIVVDPERDLVFLATASPIAAFWGGDRPGDNRWASSVVALRGSTGALAWGFQTTHHDIWDYDVAAPPTLATVQRDGRAVPAVVAVTKAGFVFVLDRETGRPLFPVDERPAPPSDVPGEQAWPTQPVPAAPPALDPQVLRPEDAWGLAWFDRRACRRRIAAARSDGLYTPPSLRGSLIFPFTGGGANWGGGALDPARHLFVINTNRLAHLVRLIPHADEAAARAANPHVEIGRAIGTPYAALREVLVSPLGLPCNRPPWGVLTAVDLDAGRLRWEVPLGSKALGLIRGLPNLGGPIITAGGLVFIAAAMDERLRAFDVETGRELWHAALPAGGQATPMTYVAGGRQFVVIAAGGHARLGTRLGDAVLAYALPP
ncbi:MAG: pyrroloquinoline quinone-dependent dehydrogenase [Alphaproteobacteria bacterium]|nr:pyrroloquinoline quinone-dependent dehydrogenase [Alphaproteobacteria bacterium]